MENKLLSTDQQLSNIHAEIVSQNRKRIKFISETVIFVVVGRELPFMAIEMIGSM